MQNNYLFWGPRSRFHKLRRGEHLGYFTKLEREVWEPWIYELRRRGKVAELVTEREQAIALQKWNEYFEEKRAKRLKERQDDFHNQITHWNESIGEWHRENNTLRKLKETFQQTKRHKLKEARKEFLQAMEDDCFRWVESPNECRFMRFRLADGVQFPYNKAAYI